MNMSRAWRDEDEVTRDLSGRVSGRDDIERASRLELEAVMAAGLAHDLSSPLMALDPALANLSCQLGALELAITETASPFVRDKLAGARSTLESIQDLSFYMTSLIRDYGRVSGAGRIGADGSATPINPAVETAARLTRNLVSHRAVLAVSVVGHPVTTVPETVLIRVLVSLILNAAEAFPGTSPQEHRIDVTAKELPDGVFLDVQDNAGGILPELRKRLFRPFVTTKREGRGLGLAVGRALLRDAGGELELVASDRERTTFRMRLPAAS